MNKQHPFPWIIGTIIVCCVVLIGADLAQSRRNEQLRKQQVTELLEMSPIQLSDEQKAYLRDKPALDVKYTLLAWGQFQDNTMRIDTALFTALVGVTVSQGLATGASFAAIEREIAILQTRRIGGSKDVKILGEKMRRVADKELLP